MGGGRVGPMGNCFSRGKGRPPPPSVPAHKNKEGTPSSQKHTQGIRHFKERLKFTSHKKTLSSDFIEIPLNNETYIETESPVEPTESNVIELTDEYGRSVIRNKLSYYKSFGDKWSESKINVETKKEDEKKVFTKEEQENETILNVVNP